MYVGSHAWAFMCVHWDKLTYYLLVYICICMYECMYACVCIYAILMHRFRYVHRQTYMSVYKQTCLYVHTYTYYIHECQKCWFL